MKAVEPYAEGRKWWTKKHPRHRTLKAGGSCQSETFCDQLPRPNLSDGARASRWRPASVFRRIRPDHRAGRLEPFLSCGLEVGTPVGGCISMNSPLCMAQPVKTLPASNLIFAIEPLRLFAL